MKAKVRETGELVEVEKRMLHFADNSTEIYYRDIFDGDRYKESELIEMADDVVLTTDTDWQVYRMEVAKECMANMMPFIDGRYFDDDCSRLSAWAVEMADALIARLKEQKEEQQGTDNGYEYMAKYYEPALPARELSQKIAKHLEGGWMLIATGKYDEQFDKYVFCKSKKGE